MKGGALLKLDRNPDPVSGAHAGATRTKQPRTRTKRPHAGSEPAPKREGGPPALTCKTMKRKKKNTELVVGLTAGKKNASHTQSAQSPLYTTLTTTKRTRAGPKNKTD